MKILCQQFLATSKIAFRQMRLNYLLPLNKLQPLWLLLAMDHYLECKIKLQKRGYKN